MKTWSVGVNLGVDLKATTTPMSDSHTLDLALPERRSLTMVNIVSPVSALVNGLRSRASREPAGRTTLLARALA